MLTVRKLFARNQFSKTENVKYLLGLKSSTMPITLISLAFSLCTEYSWSSEVSITNEFWIAQVPYPLTYYNRKQRLIVMAYKMPQNFIYLLLYPNPASILFLSQAKTIEAMELKLKQNEWKKFYEMVIHYKW